MLPAFQNKLKNTNKKLLIFAFLLTILFFGINYSLEYATDTYATFGETGTWKWMLYENGRLLNALVYYLLESLGISGGYIYKLSYGCAILFLTLAVWLLSELLFDFLKSEVLCTIISFLTIANLFVIEYFLFIEKGLFLFGIFLCVLAVRYTASYYKNKKITALVGAFLCLLLTVFIYQILLGMYVILCLPFLLYYSHENTENHSVLQIKKFLLNNFVTALLYGIPLGIAFMVTKIVCHSSRMGTVSFNLFTHMQAVMKKLLDLSTKRWFHLPPYLWITLLSLAILFLCLSVWKTRTSIKFIWILELLYLMAGTLFVSFFPFIMGITSDYLPRTLYPYGTLLGTIFIYTITNLRIQKEHILQYALTGFLILILSIQYINVQSVFLERYRCNQADQYYCQILNAKIKKYEQETGYEITTICLYKDQDVTWTEEGYHQSSLSNRAQSCGWSRLTSINLYLGKEYTEGTPDVQYENYFKQFNWGTYCEEQLIFEETILHLCVY